ncbi:MAG: 1,4-alpha-glucan branching enzyme, partial [Clostridia bacterium]|nr:1,4-alpha-glucan branching enzyme [Clostridia bacterium]
MLAFHEAGIGVILDWVPAHFPKDAHGLYEFDGQPLYEYQGADRMEHRGWGTRCFDVGREEVQSFLISSALSWVEDFHADGLRVDAVAAMLYLDYDKLPDEWRPNVYGDNRNLEAIAFFKKLNGYLRSTHPDVLTIAEESGDFGGVTAPEGLGFSYKWCMGWMNDSLSYAQLDPLWRRGSHNRMTFALTYAFSEQYVLPISHDEVVHGKKSLLDRMPGDYRMKFASERVFYAWQMTHPGKKLSFMGNEIGQFREWDYNGQIEWFLLEYEMHEAMQRYYAALNHFYLEHPALFACDNSWDGIQWIDADNADESVFSFRRIDPKTKNEVIVVLNFTPVERRGFCIGVPKEGQYREVFNSDDKAFGGSGLRNETPIVSEAMVCHGLDHRISLDLPGMSAVMFEHIPTKKPRARKKS